MNEDQATPSTSILARLHTLHPKLIDLSLGRMERLLTSLGNPENMLPTVIHVAGTNGKGSTVAYLDAMLRASGKQVNSYISPHLVCFNERIRLNGIPISDCELAELLLECEAANRGAPITFFEITTAAAFLAFARSSANFVLLEVGLGGRLDATNVIARPALSAITPISIDHTQYLGESLAKIATEKAGILKPGVPAIIAAQEPESEQTIAAQAAKRGTPLIRQGREWQVRAEADGLYYEGTTGVRNFPLPALPGAHQISNAGIAIACLEVLGADLFNPTAIAEGLAEVQWPGRLQQIFPPTLPKDWELWLDGGHNEAAGRAIAAARDWQDRPLYLVVGMLNTKLPVEFLRPLAPLITNLTAVPVPKTKASIDPLEIQKVSENLGLSALTAVDVPAALNRLTRDAPTGRVLVCGSLYLVGDVLAEFEI